MGDSVATVAYDVVLEGLHAVKHAWRFRADLVGEVTVADPARVRRLAEDLAPDLLPLLARAVVGPVEHHTGVRAVASRPVEDTSVLAVRPTPLVLLDDPRHAGNLGAVVRVAAAAWACGVVVDGDLDPWSAAVLRGAAGLQYALPVLTLAGRTVTGPIVVLDAGGADVPLPPDAVLVAGSERRGVSAAWRDRADLVLSLPMRPGVSSLNLATAVAAALYRGC